MRKRRTRDDLESIDQIGKLGLEALHDDATHYATETTTLRDTLFSWKHTHTQHRHTAQTHGTRMHPTQRTSKERMLILRLRLSLGGSGMRECCCKALSRDETLADTPYAQPTIRTIHTTRGTQRTPRSTAQPKNECLVAPLSHDFLVRGLILLQRVPHATEQLDHTHVGCLA